MKTLFAIAILFLTSPLFLEAATTVEVKAGRETINAIEGVLVLPADASFERITTGKSAVLIWIEGPAWNPENHTVSFAGFSPGGFSGTQPLFTLELSSGSVSAADGRLFGYRNDGEGTQVVLEYSFSQETSSQEDEAPPEPFRPIISSSPDLFDGARFVSFVTQDKGTGVIRYEYASTFLLPPGEGAWHAAQSPFELVSGDLFKRLHIRAVDGSGNVRVSSVAGSYHYATLVFGIIIILCVLWFLRRSFRSFL